MDWCPSPNIEYVGVFVSDTRQLLGLFRGNDTITDLDKKLELHEIGKFLHYVIKCGLQACSVRFLSYLSFKAFHTLKFFILFQLCLAKYPTSFEGERWKQLIQEFKHIIRNKKMIDQVSTSYFYFTFVITQ